MSKKSRPADADRGKHLTDKIQKIMVKDELKKRRK